MPSVIGGLSGDGVTCTGTNVKVVLPDAGSSVAISGTVCAAGGALVSVTGSPVTAPGIPGAGSTWWIIQVNTTTGAATVKQSNSAPPLPDAGNVTVFSQTLAAAENASLAVDGGQMPNTW